jgi:hypothetical protein
LLVSFCLCAVAGPTRAEDDAKTEEARRHFKSGQKLFELGHWDEAAREFEAAYAARSDPALLYNLAQAYRRKGEARRALDLYKNFLIKVPDAPQRPEVEKRIIALQRQIDRDERAGRYGKGERARDVVPVMQAPPAELQVSTAASPPPEPLKSPDSEDRPEVSPAAEASTSADRIPMPVPEPIQPAPPAAANTTPTATGSVEAIASKPASQGRPAMRTAGLVVAGVGVVALAGGIFMSVRADQLSDQVSSDARKGIFDSSKEASGRRAETWQWVGYGMGGAALMGGAMLWWFARPKDAGATTTALHVVPVVDPSRIGGVARMTF